MSEPDAAFLELHVPVDRLARWLDAPIRPAGTWTDWRCIPGTYYLGSGVVPLQDVSDDELAEQITECDDALNGFASNRAFLRSLLDSAEAPYLKRCCYDEPTGVFTAASLTYAENLILYMQFLAVARGAANALDAGGTGVGLIHNYIWDPDEKQIAVRLGPGQASSFIDTDEAYRDAVARFQPLADAMLAAGEAAGNDPDKALLPIDVLDDLI